MEEELAAAKATPNQLGPAPIFISLENHCIPAGQERLAAIMREEFGEKLITEHVHTDGTEIKLSELTGRILVMVEYYGLNEKDAAEATAEDDSSDDEDTKNMRERKRQAKPSKIVPELSALGVYAQSMKPQDDAWLKGDLKEPQNHLVNMEERAVQALIAEKHGEDVGKHNAKHLMRIYPKGMRINSKNLNPVPFWNVGAQVAALNWQTFDASMQLNEALFAGTDGWVWKPPKLRQQAGPAPKGNVTLKLEIAGATDLPVPEGRSKDIK
ncbi:hypothetical protein L7F22_053188 [Adiantum nelumboides]|nr:hypothetical protein [Adiantum nelumboides]